MNVISKVALLGLFIVSLVGCDNNKDKFDRKKGMALGNAMMAPFSRYIKKQIIKTDKDEQLGSIKSFEYTKFGELLSAKIALNLTNALSQSFEYDYENNKFNYYSSYNKINVSGGSFVKNSDNTVIEYLGNNDNTIFKNNNQFKRIDNFKNGKLLSSVTTIDKSTSKQTITWDGELPIQNEVLAFNENELVSSEIVHYSYDQDGALTKMDVTFKYADNVLDSENYFSERNEYGDWTRAKMIMKSPDSNEEFVIISTREIEYW